MQLLMWVLTVLASAIPVWLVAKRKLFLQRDYFLFFIYLQIVVYLHIAPSLCAGEISDDLRTTYAILQLLSILFFEVPLVLLYLHFLKRKPTHSPSLPQLRVRPLQHSLFLVTMIIFSGLFLYISLANDIFFRRLGQWYPIVMAGVPRWEFFTYRLFAQSAPFLIAILAYALYIRQRRGLRVLTVVALALVFLIHFSYGLANSRGTVVMTLGFLFGISVLKSRMRFGNLSFAFRAIIVVMLILYGLRVVIITRNNIEKYGLQVAYLSPFWSEETQDVDFPLEWRLNGIDLMARMTPVALRDNFALGAAWVDPVYVTFGQLFDSERAQSMKERFQVTAKYYFLVNYFDRQDWSITYYAPTMDYFSSMLTDLYGNFAIVGLLGGAVFLGWVLAYSARQLTSPTSPRELIWAVYLLSNVLIFEFEFVQMVLNIVKAAAIPVAFMILNPWVVSQVARHREKLAFPVGHKPWSPNLSRRHPERRPTP